MDWKQTTAIALSALMTAACGTSPTRQEEGRRLANRLPDATVTNDKGCTYVPNDDKSKEVCQINDFPLRPK